MPLSDEELKKSLEFLKALDEEIEGGPWEESLFFRGLGKKLVAVREEFIRDLGLEKYLEGGVTEAEAAQATEDPDSAEVYVSLYQAEGAKLPKWQAVIVSLAALSISRPIYKNEIDIQTAIRNKPYKVNDAYVAVKIRKVDIMPPYDNKPPVDRYGRELLVIREGAIRPTNITRFVHISGSYRYTNGNLIKEAATSIE